VAIQNAEDLFVTILSNLRSREDRKQQWLQAMGKEAQDPDVKQIIETRTFVQKEIVGNLDECFRQMGVQPMKPEPSQFKETWIEDFRKERDAIQAPGLKAIYTYHKLSELVDLHRSAYVALIAMADASGYYSVGALLETCLADKAAFIERNRRALRTMVERAVAGRVRAAA
jgi:ferritin-like metal-binding protein YciE